MPSNKVKADGTTSVGTNSIVDNRDHKVGDLLLERIKPGSSLSIVTAYFTLYAYEKLREVLDDAGPLRLLYGDPGSVGEVDPNDTQKRAFEFAVDGGLNLKETLRKKPIAEACINWIKRQVEIRTIVEANFLHGKMYHVAPESGESTALVGSSNFTQGGLGLASTPNIELNLEVRDEEERQALLHWFDELWNDESLTCDVKQDVLARLGRSGEVYTPEFIYYKTLFHVLEKELEDFKEREKQLTDTHLYDSKIWKDLFEFQQHGAISAINRLMRSNGCIIADSVGLGKTWTALAVIKFFELRNERVLVLCPKKLKENWTRHLFPRKGPDGAIEDDRFNYAVLAHTDLSRRTGKSGDIELDKLNWGAYGLVVIDESHNFRNEGRDRTDEHGNRILSRYGRLLEEVIKDGVPTKVLMLSATPVNTSLQDLRNQIYLMTEGRFDRFRERLGIGNFHEVFRAAENEFNAWNKKYRNQDKAAAKSELLDSLGEDFLALLDEVTIARSRRHVERFYRKFVDDIGGFPEREEPENLYPITDSKKELSYEDVHSRIGNFSLAMYRPSKHLLSTSKLDGDRESTNIDQSTRENNLVAMMRVNLLKRLESSVHSFRLTLERMLQRMDALDERIEKWQQQKTREVVDFTPDFEEIAEEDEDFVVGGKKVSYRFDELNVLEWREDLKTDRAAFSALFEVVKRVTVERDEKLATLEEMLKKKIAAPSNSKDGKSNRKVLVFTAFSDTAEYLYEEIKKRCDNWPQDDVDIALVTGSGNNQSTLGKTSFIEILEQFSPMGQKSGYTDKQIDILIATDCLSEGQNLQDCDLVVNYDIHWNPVRLMQRFGRIDRLGSRNKSVRMINIWPMKELDRYIDLKDRVEARMMLVDATATGRDNLLNPEEIRESAQLEMDFRGQQIIRVSRETLGVEEMGDSVTMSDFTLDDFVADLLGYIEKNRKNLEEAPLGIYAIADAAVPERKAQPGVIFCLRQKNEVTERTPNRLHPYFLVYVQEDGNVRYTFHNVGQTLNLFRTLAHGRDRVDRALESIFDRETNNGQDVQKYEKLLDATVRSIAQVFSRLQRRGLAQKHDIKLVRRAERPDQADKFELVTWFIVMDKRHSDNVG